MSESPETVRQAYIRVCRDSGFKIPFDEAAAFIGCMFGMSAIQIWACFPYLEDMRRIADGTHEVLKREAKTDDL